MIKTLPRADEVITRFHGDIGQALRYARAVKAEAEPLRDELMVYAWIGGMSTYDIADELSADGVTGISHVRVFQILKARLGDLSPEKRVELQRQLAA